MEYYLPEGMMTAADGCSSLVCARLDYSQGGVCVSVCLSVCVSVMVADCGCQGSLSRLQENYEVLQRTYHYLMQ
jgi:hypothetical protein